LEQQASEWSNLIERLKSNLNFCEIFGKILILQISNGLKMNRCKSNIIIILGKTILLKVMLHAKQKMHGKKPPGL
jgi:hypothetical protein